MAPERSPKRQKTSQATETPTKDAQSDQVQPPPETPPASLTSSTASDAKQQQRSSWYSSWSRKAPPIAQVAKESARSASNVASEVASTIRDVSLTPKAIRSPSLAMTLGKGRSSRASLADVTTTMVHAEVKNPGRNSSRSVSTGSVDLPLPQGTTLKEGTVAAKLDDKAKAEEEPAKQETATEDSQKEEQNQRASWLAWLSRSDNMPVDAGKTSSSVPKASGPQNVDAQETPKPQMKEIQSTASVGVGSVQDGQSSKRGWLPLWNTETSVKAHDINSAAKDGPSIQSKHSATAQDSEPPASSSAEANSQSKFVDVPLTASPPPTLPHDGTKASGWAFWSRDRKADDSSASVDQPREGEIAVSDTPSQNRPRKASVSMPKDQEESKVARGRSDPKKLESNKTVLEVVKDTGVSKPSASPPVVSHKKQDSKSGSNIVKAESSNAVAVASVVESTDDKKPGSVKSAKTATNLLLPELHATLKIPESPSLLLRLASMLYVAKEPELNHLSLLKDPPRIRNALAIGVHGYFPTPLIRSVLGQPTGTSIKFADMAAKSIKRWTSAHGYECKVKTAALEGEGKIAERLELLWKLLLNWIEEIRSSDFIMIACHSQGVPVAIMLVAKLIQFGCVNASRVCICAMAGINMGPFPEYKSRWIGGSAGELFEFTDPSSRVSTDYSAALDVVLKFGVRLTFIGSIDDQLVSLESSIYSPITHPHIFRAVSIDSRIHAPNFLSHLVGFALKLRNLGVQDHGLIRELSSPLAGSLYTGEGHSRIYEDDAVYDLAVAFAMETSAKTGLPLSQRASPAGSSNPYILPFAMRGILEEDFVKNELQSEASELLKEFDDWKPTSKVLKDVKFRLEGIRSKL